MSNNVPTVIGWDDATRMSRQQSPRPQARLTIEGRPGSVTIEGAGPWLIGRSPEAAISFPDDRSCSREQARIVRTANGFALQPLSRNVPTMLDELPIADGAALHDDARITFGVQRMVFTLLGAECSETTIISRGADFTAPADRLALDRNLTVGRQVCPGQVVFDHPAVSRRHAAFERKPDGLFVRDLGSTNGTFVNGSRIDRPARLVPGDRIDIGPLQLTFDGSALTSVARSGNAELTVSGVSFDVRVQGGNAARILDHVSFRVMPRELVCIIGASGSGKSTLMNILAGRALPSQGTVTLNGTDLHDAFESLKQDIAFVPQQDVLHEQLTLRQALDYAARLRLPRDTSVEQRKATVETAARSVDLFDRLDTKIGLLSGGQKKRASLASEILNRPSLLFLDEVTSGLDESTDREIMRLLERLTGEGMTIIVVTHTLANVEAFCHKVACMGRGGLNTFFGAPDESLAFFGVQRLGEIFNRIEEDGAQVWEARYTETATITAAAVDRPAPPQAPVRPRTDRLRVAGRAVRQFGILTQRNVRLLLADRRELGMSGMQSCLIGALMGYAFGNFGTGPEAITGKTGLLFLLSLTSIWLGCNGASKDIVGELVIYKRERDINLSTAAFVASKYVVTGLFTVLQLAVVFALTALLAEQIPGQWLLQFAILVVGGLAGTAIGLLISAASNTRDQATTIVPLALVPQIILAGVLVPHPPCPTQLFARLAVGSFWLTEAMKSVFIVADGPIRVIDIKTGLMTNMTAEPAGNGILIVAVQTAGFLLITYFVALLRYDSRKRRASRHVRVN